MRYRMKLPIAGLLVLLSNTLFAAALIWGSRELVDIHGDLTYGRAQREQAVVLRAALRACKSAALAHAAGLKGEGTDVAYTCAAADSALAQLIATTEAREDDDGESEEADDLVDLTHAVHEMTAAFSSVEGLAPAVARVRYDDVSSSENTRRVEKELSDFADGEAEEVKAADAHAMGLITRLSMFGWGLSIFGIGLVVVLLLWLMPRLLHGLSVLGKATREVSEGKLDGIVALDGDDELAQLARAFENMKRDVRSAQERQQKAEVVTRELARAAGKAEIASGVLHNVGNALNGVTVGAGLIRDTLRQSKAQKLGEALSHLKGRDAQLGGTLDADDRGKKLLAYLDGLSRRWTEEVGELENHARELHRSVEHIKVVVAKQQAHAKTRGIIETETPKVLVQHALEMVGNLPKHRIEVTELHKVDRELLVDKHRALQILTNLLKNAKDALVESGVEQRRIEIESDVKDGMLVLSVHDNGPGVAESEREKLFQYGFTTKADGHGFGLHNSAIIAQEGGGSLTYSPGVGATFVLSLPISESARQAA